MEQRPVYVAGQERSGTSLMYALLASHPNIAMSRRSNLWTHFYNQYGDLSRPENLDACLAMMMRYKRIRPLQMDPERVRREFRQGAATYGRLFALVQGHYAEHLGKPRWGDKSLHTEHFAAQVFAEFPRARILHMMRDPRDRYASVRKRYNRDSRRVGAAMGRWVNSMHAAERNLVRYPNRYMVVCFEQLAAHPEETLREICAFIDEPFVPEMLAMEGAEEHKKKGGNSSFGQLKPGVISTKPIGRFRTVLDGAEIAFIQKVATREMAVLGYQQEPVQLSLGERLAFYSLDFPVSWARMLGWLTLFKIRVRRGIHVPASRLRDITIPQATL